MIIRSSGVPTNTHKNTQNQQKIGVRGYPYGICCPWARWGGGWVGWECSAAAAVAAAAVAPGRIPENAKRVREGVAIRATDVKIPGFCTEFRAASNGTGPGPQNLNFGVQGLGLWGLGG